VHAAGSNSSVVPSKGRAKATVRWPHINMGNQMDRVGRKKPVKNKRESSFGYERTRQNRGNIKKRRDRKMIKDKQGKRKELVGEKKDRG